MKQYRVFYRVNATTCIVASAEDERDAINKANDEISEPSLCHYCSHNLSIDSVGEIIEVAEF